MDELTVERLVAGCADDSFDAGLTISTALEPLAGPGAPVKPAVYEGGRYQLDRRWWTPDGSERRPVDVVVIDNVPSQANRLEAALLGLRERLSLPELVLDLSEVALPAHLPTRLSSFLFPHRNGDAYLRDAALDGKSFLTTPVGRDVFAASAENPTTLFEWMPQALLFGYWQSHLGKKREQTKLARSWTSELAGFCPATVDPEAGGFTAIETLGLKGDPLNLSIDEALRYEPDNLLGWEVVAGKERVGKKSADSLAKIGHGQVPFPGSTERGALAGVSFASIEQRATASFAGLRRINAPAEGRALLAAIGIAGHVAAFGRAFMLRSGCDLRPTETTWTWLGADGDVAVAAPSMDAAAALVAGCAAAAERVGLPVGAHWPAPLVLQPQAKLAEVITRTWPALEAA